MERRRAGDEQLGFLTAKVEGLEALMREKDERIVERLETLSGRFEAHVAAQGEQQERIEKFMARVEQKITITKVLYAALKALGAVCLLVLTAKFGDIPAAFLAQFTKLGG